MDSLTIMVILLALADGLVWGFIAGIFFYREMDRRIEKRNKKTE